MNLQFIEDIHNYYFDNLHLLDDAKRFHFTSRLASWSDDKAAYTYLSEMRTFLLPDTTEATKIRILESLLSKKWSGKRIAHELRQPFFDKYPDLYGLGLALFRVRHLKYIYNIDLSDTLFSLYPKHKINYLRDQLMSDGEAIKFLSTYAINFCYLVDIVLNNQRPTIDPEGVYRIGLTYDANNFQEVQLLLYLYTHCIIAETNFYIDHIGEAECFVYKKMLKYAEGIIDSQFQHISLDNKLEFLVAAAICKYDSSLRSRIYEECADSISKDGTFVVDRHNTKIRLDRQTFEKSEHRNVLLVMSNLAFAPNWKPIIT